MGPKNYRLSFSRTLLLFAVIKLMSFIKISYIIGSWSSYFSMTHSVMPLLGVFVPFSLGALFISSFTWLKLCAFSWGSLAYCGLPTLCASWYWTTSSALKRSIIPLVAMVLFWMHPIGIQVWPYAFFWVIPVITASFFQRSIFAQALGSTFTAHAVGSVLWLYTSPMSVALWYRLLPIVPLERLAYALGMTLAYPLLTRFARMEIPYINFTRYVAYRR